MIGYKFTRADGTDHYTGTVNYRDNVGKVMVHPSPDLYSEEACGEGYHLGKTLKGAGEYTRPESIFLCSYSPEDILGEDVYKVRVAKLEVLWEIPTWEGYGPNGQQTEKFIESLKDIPWFENVGKPYDKPEWAMELRQVESWAISWNEAEAEARVVAWAEAGVNIGIKAKAGVKARARAGIKARVRAEDWAEDWAEIKADAEARARDDCGYAAIEIISGIEDGYFSRIMEVYRAGHFPCSWDGKTLVVY